MRRNANKLLSVQRRKIALQQALKLGDSSALAKPVNDLREAILTALKKERVRSRGNYATDTGEYFRVKLDEYLAAEQKWLKMTDEQIVSTVEAWPEAPSIRHLCSVPKPE